MPHKQMMFQAAAREKVLRGATAMADAVRVTLGPKSKCVPTSLIVTVDHAHARFFLVRQQEAIELPCLVSPRMRGGKFHSDRRGSPGWGEGGFHGRRREEERRHVTAVTRRIAAELRARDVHELVLGGSAPVLAALRRALPAAAARLVAGTAPLNPVDLTPARVARITSGLHRVHARRRQAEWLARFREAFGRRFAVEGLRDVLRALGESQIRTLMVARGFSHGGYRCTGSDRLVLTKADAQGEPIVRIGDVVAAARDDTRAQRGEVVEIEDPQLAARLDGVAALLRHR